MANTKKIIPLKDLNLTNRFLFDEVMEDPQTHQDALNIIFGHEIPFLSKTESEKELRVSPEVRSVRMDIYSMDEEGTIYNTEMQDKRKNDLAKRSRYYQALVDSSLLEPGIPNYNLLNKSYIILIMTFDLFGYERYQYTFQAACMEEAGCLLGDEAVRIFLNTKGKNDHEVSKELVEFLHYLEDTSDENAARSDSELIKRIHERVRKVKLNEEVGVKYMQAWEERYYDRMEAREEGLEEGRQVGLEEGRQVGLEEGRQVGLEEGRQTGLELGRAEGRAEGCAEGELRKIIQLTIKKIQKKKLPETIADELEEELEIIQRICEAAEKCDFDVDKVYTYLYQ